MSKHNDTPVDVVEILVDHLKYYTRLQVQAREEGNNFYANELDEEGGSLSQMKEAVVAMSRLFDAIDAGRVETFGRIVFDEHQANELRAAVANAKGEAP